MAFNWSKIFTNWPWHNKDTARDTPLSAQNLQKLNDAIDTIDGRVVSAGSSINTLDTRVGSSYSSQLSLDSRVSTLEQGGGGDMSQYVKKGAAGNTGNTIIDATGTLSLSGLNSSASGNGLYLSTSSGKVSAVGRDGVNITSDGGDVVVNSLAGGVKVQSNSDSINVNAPNNDIYENAKEIILFAKTSALNDPAAAVMINSASGLEGILLEEKVTLATLADDEALITFNGRYGSSGNVYREGRIEVHGWSAEDDHSTTEIYQDSATERLVVNGDVEITNSLEVEEIIGSSTGTDLDIGVLDSVNIGKRYNSSTSSNTGGNLNVEGVVNVNGSDYAEKFESIEDCPVGRFVTLDGEKIRLAQPGDDYILGVTSENPAIIGDKDNPGTPVGLVGKLWVESDGTCKVNGFAVSGANGIATDGGSTGYRVMAVEGNRVKVLVK